MDFFVLNAFVESAKRNIARAQWIKRLPYDWIKDTW